MSVRAKFTVTEISSFSYSPTMKRVTLQPQYDSTIPEDQRFASATPSGTLMMTVDNPAAMAQLELGKAYYIDITPVPDSTTPTQQ